MKLKGLNALITGGSQGLGKAIAEHFLAEGANVVLCARSEKDLNSTRTEFATKFPSQKILSKACDVANEAQVTDLVAFALKELGSIDALVLNAGVYGPMGPTETVDLNEWRRATSFTDTPATSVSATIRPFASSDQCLLPAGAAKSSTNPTASIGRSRWTPNDTSRANLHKKPHRSLRIQQEGGGRTPLTIMVGWMSYFFASSAVVSSSRMASRATFALNSAE